MGKLALFEKLRNQATASSSRLREVMRSLVFNFGLVGIVSLLVTEEGKIPPNKFFLIFEFLSLSILQFEKLDRWEMLEHCDSLSPECRTTAAVATAFGR